jgi:hypothetical protein
MQVLLAPPRLHAITVASSGRIAPVKSLFAALAGLRVPLPPICASITPYPPVAPAARSGRPRKIARDRPEQAADPRRLVRRSPWPRPRRVHRRRTRRQGARDARARGLHHPAGRLRPAQAPRQAPHRQTRPVPLLPRPAGCYPHYHGAACPPRPCHRAHPVWGPRPGMGRKLKIWTTVDRDCETIRINMQTLFRHVGADTRPAAAQATFCRSERCKRLGNKQCYEYLSPR